VDEIGAIVLELRKDFPDTTPKQAGVKRAHCLRVSGPI
jgi:hypothetical protein